MPEDARFLEASRCVFGSVRVDLVGQVRVLGPAAGDCAATEWFKSYYLELATVPTDLIKYKKGIKCRSPELCSQCIVS